jgi:lipid-binding SYLF domain-containing protein
MTDKGLNSLMASSVKLGGDASVAAGPIGAGANADITADLIAFSGRRCLWWAEPERYRVGVADNWNQAYYGRSVTPPDILMTARGAQSERRPAGRCNQPRGRRRQGQVLR